MTEQYGILTEEQRARVDNGDGIKDSEARRNRFHRVLSDFELLWRAYPDEELRKVFDPEDRETSIVPLWTERALAVLYLGTTLGGTNADMLLQSAITKAELARDVHARVQLDVLREELAVTDELLRRLDIDQVTIHELEWLQYQDNIDAERIARCLVDVGGNDETIEECAKSIRSLRARQSETNRIESATVVSVTEVDEYVREGFDPDDE